MKRLPFGSGHFRKLFSLAEDADRLVRNLLAKWREADHSAGALDKRHAEKCLEFAKASRQRRLCDEAGVGRLAEMAVAAQRDEILKLLQRRQVDDINR